MVHDDDLQLVENMVRLRYNVGHYYVSGLPLVFSNARA